MADASDPRPEQQPNAAADSGAPAAAASAAVPTLAVRARGEEVRVTRLHGNLFVCSRANGSCCCGWEEKGRLPFQNAMWSDEWERRAIRRQLHLTFSGCLGPCKAGNNALLQILGHSIWLKDLNDPRLPAVVFDYAEAMLQAGTVLEPPAALREHVYPRYLSPAGDDEPPLAASADHADGLAASDPASPSACPLG